MEVKEAGRGSAQTSKRADMRLSHGSDTGTCISRYVALKRISDHKFWCQFITFYGWSTDDSEENPTGKARPRKSVVKIAPRKPITPVK